MTNGADEPDDAARRAAAGAGDAGARVPDPGPQHSRLWVVLAAGVDRIENGLRARGGRGLRLAIRAAWVAVAAIGVVLLLGPVVNPPQTFDDVTRSARTATERWIARSFAVDYRLDRDADGRLVAHVVERIDAFFPTGIDEDGIERVLATDYESHDLDPTGISASLDDVALPVTRTATPTRLAIGLDSGHRLTGDHRFTLRYTLHDLAYPTTDTATGGQVDLLRWDVFGPSWPQAFASLDVRVTMPPALDDRLVRSPRGSLSWLIIGTGSWLSPEADPPAGRVAYAFTVHQNVPPNAEATFTMPFRSGTFAMPPRSLAFWVQAFGPVAPLLLLVAALLFAVAARKVAWGDAAGRAWYVAQYDPPDGVSPALAAQVLNRSAPVALATALGRLIRTPSQQRAGAAQAAADLAGRTGRLGDAPRARLAFLAAPERREVVSGGLRRIPRGYVRDGFVGAALALSALQLGLIRQLSYQARLDVVWFPVAFVAASWLAAAAILALALTARPLTAAGAIVRQHLLGVRLFAEQTALVERGPLRTELLPYAVVALPARATAGAVLELLHGEFGADVAAARRRARSSGGARVAVWLLAPLAVVAAIVTVATVPSPTADRPTPVSYSGDLPGTLATTVTGLASSARLDRAQDGSARLAVTERLTVHFDDSGSQLPQFAQQWPVVVAGHRQDLQVVSITVDGTAAPFTVTDDGDTRLLRTTLSRVLNGTHTVRVDTVVRSAAAAVDGLDRVRWAALLDGWNGVDSWSSIHGLDPLTLSVSMPAALSGSASGSWLGAPAAVPFGRVTAQAVSGEPAPKETVERAGGRVTHTLSLPPDDSGDPAGDFSEGDLGAVLDLPSGTFGGVDASAATRAAIVGALPYAAVLGCGVVAILLGVAGVSAGARRRAAVMEPGLGRDLVRLLGSALAIATVVLYFWLSAGMSGDEPLFLPLMGAAGGALVATVAGLALTRRARLARR